MPKRAKKGLGKNMKEKQSEETGKIYKVFIS